MTGVELKTLRTLAGLQQEKAAAILGVCLRTFTRWEHGETKIPHLKIQSIKAILLPQIFAPVPQKTITRPKSWASLADKRTEGES